MPDYIYQVRSYVDLNLLPRGTAGTLLQQANSNIGGYTPNDIAGAAPAAQTLRLLSVAVVGNNPNTPPTATDIMNAVTVTANNFSSKLTPSVLAQIANWAIGQP